VLELGDGAHFSMKAREDGRVFRQVQVQRLDRDFADGGAHLLLRHVDDAHSTFADDAGDPEAATEHLPDQRVRPLGRPW
jgi:hypothetical protein